MNQPGPNNLRLILWIFMSFMVLFMLGYTLINKGPEWKIIALSVALAVGIIFCFILYKASRKNN